MNKKKGISLIVLVITILVMIILAGVVVVNMTENNPIGKAKEATFKQDMQTFVEEVSLFVANKTAENSTFNKNSFMANKELCVYNTQINNAEKNVGDIIKAAKNGKYAGKVEIVQGNLYFVEPNKNEEKWLLEMGVLFKGKEKGNILLEGDTLVGVSPGYVNTGVLIVPSNVKNIAPGAFLGCKGIYQIIIPDTVTHIPDNCFRDCTNLNKIILPNTIESFGNSSFYNCTSLKDFDVPNNLKIIGTSAFQKCASITKFEAKPALELIGNMAFQDCSSLEKVTFNSKLNKITALAFRNTAVKEIVIPDNLVELDDQAFLDCKQLTKLHIGKGLVTLGSGIVRSCPALTRVTVNPENVRYFSADNCIYQKADATTGRGIILRTVPTSKKEIAFPEGLTEIGYLSFASNIGIKNLKIPEGVITLSSNAFSETMLETLELPSTLRNVNGRVLENVTTLKSITIAQGTTSPIISVEDGVIMQKTSENPLKKKIVAINPSKTGEYTIPADVNEISEFGFASSQLTKINIPSNVETIGNYAFYASSLTSLTVPGTVKTIQKSALAGCQKLQTVTLEEGITEIPGSMLDNCVALKTLVIPSSVTTIGQGCLENTISLDNILIENSQYFSTDGKIIYNKLGNVLVTASNIDQVITVKEGVTELAYDAFYGNKNLKELILPTTLTKINSAILRNTNNVKKLVVPASVTSISPSAFWDANGLLEVVIEGGKTEATLPGSPWSLPKGKIAIKWK